MDFLIRKNKIKKVYSTTGNSGCFASNEITKNGQLVGYMYREEPDSTFPDSGWRFFSGYESEEYTDDPNNFNIFDLNTICNYDPSIIKYLDAPFGTAWIRRGNEFVIDN